MNKKIWVAVAVLVVVTVIVAIMGVVSGWGRFATPDAPGPVAAPSIDDTAPTVPQPGKDDEKVNPEDDRAPYPGETVGDKKPGESIETVEGGHFELPDGVSEQDWAQAVESAEKTASDFISVALAMNKNYANPYSGYRAAYRKGLCSKKIVDDHDPGTLSVSDKRDWTGMTGAGITAEARADLDSTVLGDSGKADPDRIVLYMLVNTSLYDSGELHSTDMYGYTVTVVRDGDKYVVDEFVEGAEPLGL